MVCHPSGSLDHLLEPASTVKKDILIYIWVLKCGKFVVVLYDLNSLLFKKLLTVVLCFISCGFRVVLSRAVELLVVSSRPNSLLSKFFVMLEDLPKTIEPLFCLPLTFEPKVEFSCNLERFLAEIFYWVDFFCPALSIYFACTEFSEMYTFWGGPSIELIWLIYILLFIMISKCLNSF